MSQKLAFVPVSSLFLALVFSCHLCAQTPTQLAGKTATGSLGVVRGGTRLTAAFHPDGTVVLRTAEESRDFKGTWSQNGDRITMKAGASTFNGVLKGTKISGHRSRRSGSYVAAEDSWYLVIDADVRSESRAEGRLTFDDDAPKRISTAASALAKDPKYKASGAVTHCNEFVRDVAKRLGHDRRELDGLAGEQVDKLWAASKELQAKWITLSTGSDPADTFRRAQDAANKGKLVVVGWKNPSPTERNSGHVGIVVPLRGTDKMQHSPSWGTAVPYIAQAGAPISQFKGESVFDYLPLSWGFAVNKKETTRVFILDKP